MCDCLELNETFVKVSENKIQKGKLLSIGEYENFTGSRHEIKECVV